MRVLVTGGAGFIGSHLVRLLIEETEAEVLNVDKLTYAGNVENLAAVNEHPRYRFARVDIGDSVEIAALLRDFSPDHVIHLAAESHVDRSIDGADAFIQTNVVGTCRLLGAVQGYCGSLDGSRRASFRFQMVSTDEVFGSLDRTGYFSEDSPYRPNSPYAASKASADHFAQAWQRTYGLPVIITHCSNNYGPNQYPEKLIPVMILAGIQGERMPIYGRGKQVRDWIHVSDHVRALWLIANRGEVGNHYCIGSGCEKTNLEMVEATCAALDELLPDSPHRPHRQLVSFVTDRPGHDFRYATDASKLRRELGWRPIVGFEQGLRETVAWYLENRDWCERTLAGVAATRRRGLGSAA